MLGVTSFALHDLWATQLLAAGVVLAAAYAVIWNRNYYYGIAALVVVLALPSTAQLKATQIKSKQEWLAQSVKRSKAPMVRFLGPKFLKRKRYFGDPQAADYLKLQLSYLSRDTISIRTQLARLRLSGENRTFSAHSQDRIEHIKNIVANDFRSLMPKVEAWTFLGLTGLVILLLLTGFGLQLYASRLNRHLTTVGKLLAKWKESTTGPLDGMDGIDGSTFNGLAARSRRLAFISILAYIAGLSFIILCGKAPYYLFVDDKGFDGIVTSIGVLRHLQGIWIGNEAASRIVIGLNLIAAVMPFVMLVGLMVRKPRLILLPLLIFTVVAVSNRTNKTFEGLQASLSNSRMTVTALQGLSKAVDAKRNKRETGEPRPGITQAVTRKKDIGLVEVDYALMQMAYLLGEVELAEKHYKYYAKGGTKSVNQSDYRVSLIYNWLRDNDRNAKPVLSEVAERKLVFTRIRYAAFAVAALVSLLVSAFALALGWKMKARLGRIKEMSRRTNEAAASRHAHERRQLIIRGALSSKAKSGLADA